VTENVRELINVIAYDYVHEVLLDPDIEFSDVAEFVEEYDGASWTDGVLDIDDIFESVHERVQEIWRDVKLNAKDVG
jgi:hypothetical protein